MRGGGTGGGHSRNISIYQLPPPISHSFLHSKRNSLHGKQTLRTGNATRCTGSATQRTVNATLRTVNATLRTGNATPLTPNAPLHATIYRQMHHMRPSIAKCTTTCDHLSHVLVSHGLGIFPALFGPENVLGDKRTR